MKLAALLAQHGAAKLALSRISESTNLTYGDTARRLPSWLLARNVKTLKPADLERAYAEMLKVYTPATVKLSHTLLVGALDRALRDGEVVVNAARQAATPKDNRTHEDRALSSDQVHSALAAASLDRVHGFLFRFALGTGLRRGELCALEWENIDFQTGVVAVARNVVENGKYLRTLAPKSRAGTRLVTLPATLLAEAKSVYLARKAKPNDPVFVTGDGRRVRPSSASVFVGNILRRAGVKDHSLHSLRHTHATRLVSSGAPLPAVARRMGHADARTTLSIYAHPQKGEDAVLAQTIEGTLT